MVIHHFCVGPSTSSSLFHRPSDSVRRAIHACGSPSFTLANSSTSQPQHGDLLHTLWGKSTSYVTLGKFAAVLEPQFLHLLSGLVKRYIGRASHDVWHTGVPTGCFPLDHNCPSLQLSPSYSHQNWLPAPGALDSRFLSFLSGHPLTPPLPHPQASLLAFENLSSTLGFFSAISDLQKFV